MASILDLPNEITHAIFELLVYDPYDVAAVQSVCRAWRALAADPVLWHDLLLDSAEEIIAFASCPRAPGTTFGIKLSEAEDCVALLTAAQADPGLREILVHSVNSLDLAAFATEEEQQACRFSDVIELFRESTTLRTVHVKCDVRLLPAWPSVETMWSGTLYREHLSALPRWPRLVNLQCEQSRVRINNRDEDDDRTWTPAEPLGITSLDTDLDLDSLELLFTHCPRLRRFTFAVHERHEGDFAHVVKLLARVAPQLEHVNFWFLERPHIPLLTAACDCSRLTKLTLGGDESLRTADILEFITRRTPHLVHLSLHIENSLDEVPTTTTTTPYAFLDMWRTLRQRVPSLSRMKIQAGTNVSEDPLPALAWLTRVSDDVMGAPTGMVCDAADGATVDVDWYGLWRATLVKAGVEFASATADVDPDLGDYGDMYSPVVRVDGWWMRASAGLQLNGSDRDSEEISEEREGSASDHEDTWWSLDVAYYFQRCTWPRELC